MFFSTAKRTKSAPTSELLLCILKLAFRNVRVSSWPGNACIQKQQQRKMKNFPNLDTKSCRWYNVVLRIKAHIQDILRGQQKRFSPYYRMAFLLVRRTSHISYVERYFQSCKQNCKNFPNWEKKALSILSDGIPPCLAYYAHLSISANIVIGIILVIMMITHIYQQCQHWPNRVFLLPSCLVLGVYGWEAND